MVTRAPGSPLGWGFRVYGGREGHARRRASVQRNRGGAPHPRRRHAGHSVSAEPPRQVDVEDVEVDVAAFACEKTSPGTVFQRRRSRGSAYRA